MGDIDVAPLHDVGAMVSLCMTSLGGVHPKARIGPPAEVAIGVAGHWRSIAQVQRGPPRRAVLSKRARSVSCSGSNDTEMAMSQDLQEDDVEAVDACEPAAAPMREVPDIPFGITRCMRNEDYHGDRSAVSSTQLKRMLISPAHFLSGISDPEESTEALLFGSVLHGRLLEPDTFESRFFAMPKLNRARKEGKQRYAECLVQAAGRTVYPEAWKEPIERIIDNAMGHRKARELLAKGEAEVALVWLDPDTGIKCKIKIDWWHDARTLADVKSAEDVTFEGFRRSCARLGYALSAAMYCEGVYQLTGEEPEWAFIACEKARPNTIAVYRATRPMLERGRSDFRRALRRLAECRERGHFPMLQADGEWEDIDLPRWA
ncbi:PD-(D/E)XK nuclease-like domain-containing protein [Piscinibacter koreensis]|uniref:PD-(D/E)XK nuclease-like domain-containing protein n=1 Tax=Piscinibacter koreensis TaxID=2742824 RepID=A0A7Y6TYS2_9BURK|nr:PD-(D/E)XK nuclease-like domain-containing protein [Schlegelella koreensis]NUZ08524.1 PD-(D/E)XK nuclease-like domain-containing protein [Schlegelella koreensis]